MADRYDKEITDLKRRVSNSVVIGTVMAVDHEKGRYRVKVGDLESDWVPMATPRAGKTSIYSSYEEGEQVIMASPSGDLSQGVIMAAIATGATQAADKGTIHRIKYPDGTTVDYDHEGHGYKMSVAAGGSFELLIGGGASVRGDGNTITHKAANHVFEGDVKIKGSFAAEGGGFTHNDVDVGSEHGHVSAPPGPPGPPVS